jgi:hypothetical protein
LQGSSHSHVVANGAAGSVIALNVFILYGYPQVDRLHPEPSSVIGLQLLVAQIAQPVANDGARRRRPVASIAGLVPPHIVVHDEVPWDLCLRIKLELVIHIQMSDVRRGDLDDQNWPRSLFCTLEGGPVPDGLHPKDDRYVRPHGLDVSTIPGDAVVAQDHGSRIVLNLSPDNALQIVNGRVMFARVHDEILYLRMKDVFQR